MKSTFNKTNAPYFVVSALAIGTLLVSGVFAAAPYAGFLAPVAVLGVGLPFIIGGAVFSALVIALSAVIISKNNTISEKGAQLASQAQEINAKDRAISKKDIQLAEKTELITTKDKKLQKID